MGNTSGRGPSTQGGLTMSAVFAETLRLRLKPGDTALAPNTTAAAAASE